MFVNYNNSLTEQFLMEAKKNGFEATIKKYNAHLKNAEKLIKKK